MTDTIAIVNENVGAVEKVWYETVNEKHVKVKFELHTDSEVNILSLNLVRTMDREDVI